MVEFSKVGNSKGDLTIRGCLQQVGDKAGELLAEHRAGYIEGGLHEELCEWFDERLKAANVR